VTATARIAFALLVVATIAAFFAAQELKTTPPNVQDVRATEVFSPNRDGRKDRMYMSFFLKRTDDVTATVVSRAGDAIRVLADRRLPARRRMRLRWDGSDARGRTVPDGIYRVRLSLRRQGRAVLIPRNITKDTVPPDVAVTSIGPERRVVGPELLPRVDGRPAEVHFKAPTRPKSRKEILVFRTDVRPARAMFDRPVKLADDATSWTWSGRVDGRRVTAGTYAVIVRARDLAGNIGASAPVPPRFEYARPLPGRGGITVRYLRAQSSTLPVKARETAAVAVDSVGERFTWRLRRIGDPGIRNRGSGTRSRIVHFAAPGGKSGLYLFEVRTRSRRTAAPVVVTGRQARDVLVVLPLTTWQGLNGADDDGDGLPDTLSAGLPVQLARPFVKSGIPPQIRRNEALLLAQLDRKGRRYDITTDVALARGEGPKLAEHRGVIIAGDARWLDTQAARALRGFVRDGGRLLSVGTRSLRRSVTFTPRGRAISPTLPTRRDLFGARIGPLVRPAAPVSLVNSADRIDLFAGTAGLFGGLHAFEPTLDVRGGAGAVLAAAATQDGGDRQVIVAARFGKGIVIRTGLPEFSARVRADADLSELLDRIWTLLRTR
jgi:hypothetical protein